MIYLLHAGSFDDKGSKKTILKYENIYKG